MQYLTILLSVTTLVYAQNVQTKIFSIQELPDVASKVLLIVTWSNNPQKEIPKITNCEIFSDEKIVGHILKEAGESTVIKPSIEEVVHLVKDCTGLLSRNSETEIFRTALQRFEHFREIRRRGFPISNDAEMRTSEETMEKWKSDSHDSWYIFPGTKWCGPGDVAQSFDDLGSSADTDKCCRAHDLCDDLLRPGEKKENIINTSWFTLLSCECDDEFYDCLKNVSSNTSNSIGNAYFNLGGSNCYTLNYPLTDKCLNRYLIYCAEYERNTTAPMVYEWRKAKFYDKFPIATYG
ncbi:uncharacterized protein LOC118195056 [Stegodyphus dumicola]|uniref:uncharacterized protein LOC118195056 n=1 Tax=Stegodyphus dumicola TaxID=202533 RepID=UPI0015A7D331|nr:uncharacterized protein LOC118195056 [Stegodyphus dumicola]